MKSEGSRRFRLGVGTRIFIVFFVLSVVILLLVSSIALITLEDVGNYAAGRSRSLGTSAVSDSTAALENTTREYLVRLAGDQADISDVIFTRVDGEMEIMGQYAAGAMETADGNRSRYYTQKDTPPSPLSTSVFLPAPGSDLDPAGPEFRAMRQMDRIFIPVFAADRHLTSVYIASDSGATMYYPWTTGIDPSFDSRVRGWYKDATQAGKTTWSAPYVDVFGNGLMVTCSRPVSSPDHKWNWVIGADVTIETINQQIINTQVGDAGYALLIDRQGNVITAPGMSAGAHRWNEDFRTENLFESNNSILREMAGRMASGETGVSRVNLGKGEMFVAYAPVRSMNWTVAVVLPVAEVIAPAVATEQKISAATDEAGQHITSQVSRIRNIYLALFLVLTAAVSVLTVLFTRVITGPVRVLRKGAEEIGQGNLDYTVDLHSGDEFEELAGSFNRMTGDLKGYIEELRTTTAQKERMSRELEIAKGIQQSFLPESIPLIPGYEVAAFSLPALEVGGDFYDFIPLPDGRWGLTIADVSGKGIPAALFMALSRTLVRASTQRNAAPGAAIREANQLISQDARTSMFVTLFYAILDPSKKTLTYVNAGHNPPILFHPGSSAIALLRAAGIALGVLSDNEFESVECPLAPGDTIVLYTDGVTEAFNASGEEFGEARLVEVVQRHYQLPPDDLIREIHREISAFAGSQPQADDITLLVLRASGSP
jgi:sigma-B regulation protein RsbU (phosphoserine phosphatase)